MEKTSKSLLYRIISFSLILAAVLRFGDRLLDTLSNGINTVECSEFLVNFSGGFVRRGLLGEILYDISQATGISPYPLILGISIICLAFVVTFFLKAFVKRDMNWWIVLSPMFCGFLLYFVRKDFMMYALLIVVLLMLRRWRGNPWNIAAVCALSIFGLMLHEAYLFWAIPLTVLAIYAVSHSLVAATVSALAFLGCFGVLSVFKGDASNVTAIMASWNSLGVGLETCGTSIKALEWESVNTFLYHLRANFHAMGATGAEGWLGVVVRPMFFMVTYYFISNFSWVFRKKGTDFNEDDRTNLSAVYLLCALTMLPMFTVLSCDYSRLYQYLFVSAYAAVLILPRDVCSALLPRRCREAVSRLNASIWRYLTPTKWIMVILLLLLSASPCRFNMLYAFGTSVIGTLAKAGITAVDFVARLFMM